MSKNLVFILFISLFASLSALPELVYAQGDLRYMSSQELRQEYARREKQDLRKEVLRQRKKQAALKAKLRQVRLKLRRRSTTQNKRQSSYAKKKSHSKKKSQQVKRRRVRKPKLVKDTLVLLNETMPDKQKQITKLLTMVDHVHTYYSINTGADLSELMKDRRFKEIYEAMNNRAKKATYYYLKGVYENSTQAIEDKSEQNLKRLAELKLNRDYEPSKTDIDGFNEKTSIKSILVRSLSGKYVRPQLETKQTDGAI